MTSQVTLQQFNRWDFGPNPSPFCVKAEAFLRLAKIRYDVSIGRGGSNGRAPSAVLRPPQAGAQEMTVDDSQRIIETVKRVFSITIDDHLTPEQIVLGEALRQVLETSMYFCITRQRWVDNPKWMKAHLELAAPGFLRGVIFSKIRSSVIETLDIHSNGDMSNEEYNRVFLNDMKFVAYVLGEKTFLFGDSPTSYDCVAYGMIGSILKAGLPCLAHQYMKDSPSLVSYVERMENLLFPDLANLIKADKDLRDK